MSFEIIDWKGKDLKKNRIDLIQINLGNRCNLHCTHCHIGASSDGKLNMDYETASLLISKLKDFPVQDIEFTGGEPTLNRNLRLFIKELTPSHKNITVRTNLTAIDLPSYSDYPEFFREYKVNLIASLPCIFPETVDRQRGGGVFQKSLKILTRLNHLGYGKNGLRLDLVYNPGAGFLPPDQNELTETYKKTLKERYDITFNNLITMVNSPINRFREYLIQEDKLDDYSEMLKNEYNPATLDKIMCRNIVSVDYDGYIYDCDFNLAMGMKIKGYEDIRFWEVDFADFNPVISFDKHCYACTAGSGSSCHGGLI